jgi:TonB family protein
MLSVVEDRDTARSVAVLPPSPVELNLLLEWPAPTSRWRTIFGASLAFHLLLFFAATRMESLIGPLEPEQRVIVKRTPLYIPPDVLTQKAHNRDKVSKHIDLADLLPSQELQARRAAPNPSRKRFELPKQITPQQTAKNSPRILAEAPNIALNQPSAPLPPGSPVGMIAPPPPAAPAASPGPFQNVGAAAPPNPHPKLVPKASVQSTIAGLAQDPNSRRLIISDDNSSQPLPGSPGSLGTAGGPHAAVELQSDPQGADFKPYLANILAIVRANWRRVIPESARMGTLRGRTVVEFVINRDGSIPKLVTADSSGSEPLDRAAVAGLSMSNPLPPLPSDFKGFQVRLAFSFAYNMPSQ